MTVGSKTRTAQTFLQCSCCGNINPIFRKRSKMKVKNHIKHMYCPVCKDVRAHIEVKEDIFIPKWISEWQEEQQKGRRSTSEQSR